MSIDQGKLEKVKIIAYSKPEMDDASKTGDFTAFINPESYQLNYKIEYNEGQGQGTSGKQQKFKAIAPDELALELLFDATGIIDDQPRDDIWNDVKTFKQLLTAYEGDAHEPRHFRVIWGPMLFAGRLTSLNITFKLFRPDGRPIRALCKVTFKSSIDDKKRVAKEDPLSPDLTHIRTVKSGDHISLKCYQQYEDPKYYFDIARANNLTNFRKLVPGAVIKFLPLSDA
ncbi:LysM peptidoglycan-binding domain-containing protein [Chitinophaga sp. Cy-1792]|uniref:CIS tube protein n=1 Tax=Chitinophaga sp. Cy-1792 TaxID=2608339 RepID=UPI0014213176|nr:LysM peptidoglycan-binding domain-containing protein [Chitinophaga sp. Cy-1792]NIG53826.1 LysM peptidoglycan-binding domain-containing protein [Chitinophaga sp. Cy-1792]